MQDQIAYTGIEVNISQSGCFSIQFLRFVNLNNLWLNNRHSISFRGTLFCLRRQIQTEYVPHEASYLMCTLGYLQRVKQLERECVHSAPCIAKWRMPGAIPIYFILLYSLVMGQDSAAIILTRYEPDDPGLETRWWRDFPHRPERPQGPIQHTKQWIKSLAWAKAAGAWR